MKRYLVALVFGAILASAGQASAQVAWDAPFLAPPKAEPGLGLFLADPSAGKLGVVGTWRKQDKPMNLGYRLGIANDAGDNLSALGGVDISGRLTRSTNDFPLDVDWVMGAGIGLAKAALLTIPVGITMGHTFDSDGVQFTPYLTPRVSLDAWMGGGVGTNLDMRFAIDIGLDLALQKSWKIRFGGSFGDRSAVALGLVF